MNRKEAERRAVEEVRRIRKKDTGVFNPVELLDKIERLKAENAQLRAELASVKQKNAKLEQRIETLNNELESRVSYYNTSGKWGEY